MNSNNGYITAKFINEITNYSGKTIKIVSYRIFSNKTFKVLREKTINYNLTANYKYILSFNVNNEYKPNYGIVWVLEYKGKTFEKKTDIKQD